MPLQELRPGAVKVFYFTKELRCSAKIFYYTTLSHFCQIFNFCQGAG